MLEKDLQRKLIALLKKEHSDIYAVKIMSTNQCGFPDLLLIKNGKILLIELKSEKGTLSSIQRYQHKRLKSYDVKVEVIRSLSEAKQVISQL